MSSHLDFLAQSLENLRQGSEVWIDVCSLNPSMVVPGHEDGLGVYVSTSINRAAFVDALLDAIPSLIEPDESATTVDPRKRAEFGHVKANVEHLRHVIRQYYRNVNI